MEKSSEDVTKWIESMQSLSRVFLNNVGRTYLDEPLNAEASRVQLTQYIELTYSDTYFLKIDQVGEPLEGMMNDPFTSLQTTLSACHNPNQHRMLFLVINDGVTNELYLGISADNAYSVVKNLGAFLQSNWHGIRYSDSVKGIDDLQLPRLTSGVALTGIPSLKLGEYRGYPQSLDRILRGLQGSPFTYLVIADPMSSEDVLDIIYRCRDWIGTFHNLIKTTHSGTITLSANTNISSGKNTSHSFSAGVTMGHRLPLNANYTFATGESFSFSEGVGTNISQTVGKEYVNSHAQAVIKLLEQYIVRFEHALASGCWNVGIYFLAGSQEVINGAIRLRSLLSGETSAFEPIRIHDLRPVWKKGVEARLYKFEKPPFALVKRHPDENHEHLLGKAFSGLTTPLNTEELAILVNLPRRETPGVHVVPVADFSLNPPPSQKGGILLGRILQGGEPTSLTYSLPLATLAKHTLVTGINGSGKSTTCRYILSELLERHIPFLVIEPAKDEYISWAMQINRERQAANKEPIAIYVPGLHAWHGEPLEAELALNPFEVIWLDATYKPNILSHIDRLKSILVATFPMQEVLPLLLEDIMFSAYTQSNWLGDTLPAYKTPFPTLSQLKNQILVVVTGKRYEDHVTRNLIAALTTRIDNLRRGWKGKLFDQPTSTPFPTLFEHPTVINLSYLGDDADKAFTMAILLQFLYEYRQLQHELVQNSNTALHHLTIIEEAHRILQHPQLTNVESANPQAKMAEMFAHNLAELRAYGQGFMIVDQVPAKLIPDAVKNTNLKIVHRLVSGDDREAIAQSMSLTESQTKVINRLHSGQAIVYGDLDDMASWIYVSPKRS